MSPKVTLTIIDNYTKLCLITPAKEAGETLSPEKATLGGGSGYWGGGISL